MHIYKRSDSTAQVVAGSTFAVELASNATTGFQWQLHIDGAAVALESTRIVTSARKQDVGAAATQRFALRAADVGTATLTFVLKREWESSALDTHTMSVTVTRS
jgi:predicted secreted protein